MSDNKPYTSVTERANFQARLGRINTAAARARVIAENIEHDTISISFRSKRRKLGYCPRCGTNLDAYFNWVDANGNETNCGYCQRLIG